MMQNDTRQSGISTDFTDSDKLFKEAVYYLQRREPNMAVHVLNRILESKPGDSRCLSYLGLCMAMVNRRSSEALELCEGALAAGHQEAFFYCNLGKVHSLRGSRRKAYKAFTTGLKVDSRNREIVKELRSMGVRQGAFFSSLPRGHFINRFFGRMRNMLRRPSA